MVRPPEHPGTSPRGSVNGVHVRPAGHESATPGVQRVLHVVWACAVRSARAAPRAAASWAVGRMVDGWAGWTVWWSGRAGGGE